MAISDQATVSNDLAQAIDAFDRALRRDGTSPDTVDSFGQACRRFADWMVDHGHGLAMDRVAVWHVEDWEAHLRRTLPHETFHDNHRALQQFLGWYAKQRDADWRQRSAWRRAPLEGPGR
jgi:hypothetical protein